MIQARNIDFTTLPGNYSLEEQDTGFTWVDGKKIYKKTISLGNLPNSNSKTISHGILNLGFVINIEAAASDGTYRISIPLAATNTTSQVSINVQPSAIEVTSGNNRSSYVGYATIYYTKTG